MMSRAHAVSTLASGRMTHSFAPPMPMHAVVAKRDPEPGEVPVAFVRANVSGGAASR
jgi:hypothetical protein